MSGSEALSRVITFCGKCSCGCPELYIDHEAEATRRVVLTDDFGQRIQMSIEQLEVIVDEARAGRITSLVAAEIAAGG
ncbi:hypothetical protein CcI49_30920 [Frankia sp. CcI49]|uniref:Uncharacterized protein n=1 Tax=Parafrankia irregularis TaxID=795642 RepID=A0A0S4QR93_9ACTN|nr:MULTISPECIES: hypothetical protein [Frankiaceae]EFC81556.1 hypothetical protein FrEUN1fDRAFT_5328 [Parafrankia sp. EUN1f]KPM50684.1 hypothetical protein ACG83_38485 [Frankia sp. R43]MBE3199851.1 hypothetical protein [Parafrankia sp. CH37]ONH54082.1 hypothetical protein CcI49_30920 [Frankia sp. CcI49]CUU58003.1 hypothetical protein Ga0074812_11631 [Parafrankia irregularis]